MRIRFVEVEAIQPREHVILMADEPSETEAPPPSYDDVMQADAGYPTCHIL